MSIVFFEGFNISNSDTKKLDTNYWSIPENDITFGSGRTNNGAYIRSSPYASGMTANKRLDLTNFISPLTNNNALGLGFYVTEIKQNESKLVSFHNGASEVLSINVITTSYNSTSSIGLDVVQGGVSVGIYDFKSPVGYTYGLPDAFYVDGGWRLRVNQATYLEFFIDSKNANLIRIRVNGLDMYNGSSSTNTTITGFSNIDKISLYGAHDNVANSTANANRLYDDLYLTGGSDINNTLLGSNTKIYRIGPESNSATMDWYSLSGDNHPWLGPSYNANGDVSTNDGDNSYIYTVASGNTSLFNMSNLPTGSTLPSGVGGIKVFNTARKLIQDSSFVNVYASGDGQTIAEFGPQHQLTQASYDYYNHFAFQNPQTNTDWTIEDINNMQLGVRKLA